MTTLAAHLVREVPLLPRDALVREGVAQLHDTQLPALPVVDADERLVGLFGEGEFLAAILPGYLRELRDAGFVPRSMDLDIEHRPPHLDDPLEDHMRRERTDVEQAHSDAQLAETFLHHGVLVVPVVDEHRRVLGIVTRTEFFAALAARTLR